MAADDGTPRHIPPHRRQDDLRDRFSRRREYEEITSLLRALRAADFDLGNMDDGDDERILTQMLKEWRGRYNRRVARKTYGARAGRWFLAAVGGALVTLFGPDAHAWLKSHYPW